MSIGKLWLPLMVCAVGNVCLADGSAQQTADGGSRAGICSLVKRGGSSDVVVDLYREYPWDGRKIVEHEPREVLQRFFTPTLTELLVQDYECEKREEGICHLNSLVLYATQDPDVRKLGVCLPSQGGRQVLVVFENNGRPVRLVFRMEKTPTGWRVADIRYPEGGSLLSTLGGQGGSSGHSDSSVEP